MIGSDRSAEAIQDAIQGSGVSCDRRIEIEFSEIPFETFQFIQTLELRFFRIAEIFESGTDLSENTRMFRSDRRIDAVQQIVEFSCTAVGREFQTFQEIQTLELRLFCIAESVERCADLA